MALIDELKEKRETALNQAEALSAQWYEIDEKRVVFFQIASDCEIAIQALTSWADAALSPPPADPDFFSDKEAARELLEREELVADDPPEPPLDEELAQLDADGSFDAPQGETHFDEAEETAARDTLPQPEWNEPQGYAPVIDPKPAPDVHSDPDRNRGQFNPFNIFRREDA